MAREIRDNIRLGIFITLGLVILIVSLYLIGKNQNLFGSSFHVKARFNNINGLMAGNNVRYSGIQAGTVKSVTVIDDTTIEVYMLINKKMKPFIRQNSLASIGNEGLMGNKVINIVPGKGTAAEIAEDGMLITKRVTFTDEMMETLSGTNINAAIISENLKNALIRINNSKALWDILDDTSLSVNVHKSIANINHATERINDLTESLNAIANDVRAGKGTAGAILSDPKLAANLKQAVQSINNTSKESESVIAKLDSIASKLNRDMNGKGTVQALLKDTAYVGKLNRSLTNVENGTAAFNQNMEALKHNVLTRGYFRKQDKKQKKAAK